MVQVEYEKLSLDVKRTLQGIRGAEEHLNTLQKAYVKEVHELERKWSQKFQAVYNRRLEMLSGTSPPTAQEIAAGEERSHHLSHRSGKEFKKLPSLKNHSSAKAAPVKGFWLQVLKTNLETATHVQETDEPALEHLTNIALAYPPNSMTPAFIIEFHFSPNKYFKDSVLKLGFVYKDYVDAHGHLAYSHVTGDTIHWKPKQNLIQSQPNNDSDAEEEGSFFGLFQPPSIITRHAKDSDDNDEREFLLDHAFDIGVALKTTIISRATDYFIGDLEELDSDDDDDDWEGFDHEHDEED